MSLNKVDLSDQKLLDSVTEKTEKATVLLRTIASNYAPATLANSLSVEDMVLTSTLDDIDPATGELRTVPLRVLPTHYKSPLTGALVDVENPDVWVYRDEASQESNP